MARKVLIGLILLMLPAFMSLAADGQADQPEKGAKASDAKELSGMSIVGNDDAPKSLYIVPWKSSELGVETSLNMLLDDREKPLDKEVFLRRLAYYQVRTENNAPSPHGLTQQY